MRLARGEEKAERVAAGGMGCDGDGVCVGVGVWKGVDVVTEEEDEADEAAAAAYEVERGVLDGEGLEGDRLTGEVLAGEVLAGDLWSVNRVSA